MNEAPNRPSMRGSVQIDHCRHRREARRKLAGQKVPADVAATPAAAGAADDDAARVDRWMRAAPVRPCARLGSHSSLRPCGRLGAGEQTQNRLRCRPCPCPRRAAGPGASGAMRCECAARCARARCSRSTVHAHSEESVCSRQMLSGNCPRKLWPLRSLQRCVHTHSRRKGRWIERSSAARANALTFALSFRGTTGRPA